MKISYNWLKNYVDFDWSPQELGDRLTMTGLEVEGLSVFESLPGGLNGVVIGKVLEAEQHPNADRLKVCKVDLGEGEPVQIVCGAPNVAAGQKVPVATVGAELHPIEGDPFKIKKGKIRGEVSLGMICAEDELGLGKGHDGIMVLDEKLEPGTPAREAFDIEIDHVFEIGLTANRIDAASHFGTSRDIAALKREKAKLPEINARVDQPKVKNPVFISIEHEEKCPRYAGMFIQGIEVKDSPEWLQFRLKALGLRPINNIVDITNYVLHELGQPLHAFDADQIAGNQIVVKTLDQDTPFTTLDDVERTIRANTDLMICDGEKPVAVAGVMGGQNSEVSENTKNVFLECAYFNSTSIRKTAKHLGLSTDASFRFERGIDPNITLTAIRRCADLILELAGGEVSEIIDVQKQEFPPFEVEFDLKRANVLMGYNFSVEEVTSILNSLDIEVAEAEGMNLKLQVPQYRVDVQRPQDVMEEILRIHGYNNVPFSNQTTFAIDLEPRREPFRILQKYFDYLAGSGWSEILTNSIVPQRMAREGSVDIINNLSEELAVLRDQMLSTGLETLAFNINRNFPDLQFCEFGKTYHLLDGEYQEKEWITLLLTGKTGESHWRDSVRAADLFTLTREMERLQAWFNFSAPTEELGEDELFEYGLQLKRGDNVIARWGRANAELAADKGVEVPVFFAIINWQALLKIERKGKVEFEELSKFPSTQRDISMLVPENAEYAAIRNLIQSCNPKMITDINITDIYRGKGIPEGKKSYLVNLTLHDPKKTITDKTADKLMARIFQQLEKQAGAEIRK